jgi:putative ABC transport system permease protein
VIEATIPHIERVVPMREVCFEVSYGSRRYGAKVVGAPASFFRTINVGVSAGRPIEPHDLTTRAKVCVIGDEVRRRLFAFEDPIGRSLTANNLGAGAIPYEVVGVMERVLTAGRPARGIGERDLNSDVIIPLTTADTRYGDTIASYTAGTREMRKIEYSDVYIRVSDLEHVKPVSEMISRAIEYKHESEKDVQVQVPLARLRLAEQEKRNRQITLGAIAGISLLVGGIGIMNIMLASVTERTREIGIRRALGAKQRHITTQFLIETVVLSTAGGVVGIALGATGAWVITELAGWETIVRAWTVAVSFGLSVMIGVFFGMYPAVAAAKLDPIEALRHE